MATKNLHPKTVQLMAPAVLLVVLLGVLCLDLGCSVNSSPPPPTRSGAVGGADASKAPQGDVAIMVAGQKWTGNTDIDSATLRVVGD
jgi:hypothetical protein